MKSKDKRPHVHVKVCGQKFHSLIDCGSQITAISFSSYNTLPPSIRPKLEPVTTPLQAANGTTIKTKGQVSKMPIFINGIRVETTLVVIDGLSKSFILGADTIERGNFIIDPSSKLKLRCKLPAICAETKNILPNAENLIKASIPKELINNMSMCVFMPKQQNMPSVLSHISPEGQITVLIQNLSNDTITIKRQELLGYVIQTDQEDIITDISYTHISSIHKQVPSQQIHLEHLSETERKEISTLIDKYPDVFSLDPNDIGHCTILPQRLILKDNTKISCIPPYRIAPQLQPIVHAYVDKLYQAKVIQKSTSPFCSPLLLVKKAGSSPSQPLVEQYRVVHDFRKLNNNTIRDAYPLHNIHDLIDKVAGAKFWSVIDLSSGFWNQSLHKSSRPYTAFAVPGKGHYEYTRTAQGLANSPAAFQRLLDFVVQGLPGVYVYIDDVIVATNTMENHVATLAEVFKRFRKYNLKCRPKKIQLLTKEINYLGYNLTQGKGIRAGEAKTKVIKDFKSPTDITEIRRFLGLCSFFRRTIPDFSTKAQPLTRLTRKDAEWKKGKLPNEAENAFQALKAELIKRPCLQPPDFTKPFILTVDASTKGLGAILSQEHGTSEHPIAYGSRALNDTEQKYAPFRLEYLALLWACKHFKPYLVGKRFQVRTDHKPLLSFNKEKGSVYDRYLLELSEFDFEMKYLPGNKMPADFLSRIETDEKKEKKGAEKEIHEITNVSQMINISSSQLKELQQQDKFIKALAIYLRYGSLPQHHILREYVLQECKNAQIQNGIVMKGKQAFTPHGLKMNLIHLAHDTPMSGHFSTEKTLAKLNNWYWPEQKEDVKVYCRSCPVCLSNNPTALPIAALGKLQEAKDFNDRVHIDLLGPLPNNSGYKYAVVMVDAYSKFLQVAAATSKEMNEISQIFFNHWICSFGPCKQLVSDLGKEFKNQMFSLLSKQYGIHQSFTTANHPMANGMAERAVQAVLTYIRKYVQGNEWVHLLSPLTFAHNTTVRKPTGYSPYEAVFGRKTKTPGDLNNNRPNYSSNPLVDIHNTIQSIKGEIESTQEKFYKSMKDSYDKRIRFNSIQEGDKVYVIRPHKGNQFQKFQQRFEGPYSVLHKTQNNNLQLKHCVSHKPKTIHINNVKLLPFLHAFPEYSIDLKEGGPQRESMEKESNTNKNPLLLDDTPLPQKSSKLFARGNVGKSPLIQDRINRTRSPSPIPFSISNSSSSSSASSFNTPPITPPPVPARPPIRHTRSTAGPLPENVLHTYPQERRTLSSKVKEFFSPKK